MKSIILILLCLTIQISFADETEKLRDSPVLYKGRFRPQESYARLWLYDVYHKQSIRSEDRALFKTPSGSALDFLWKLQIHGSQAFEETPLFWIHYAKVKDWLGFNRKKERFSYKELSGGISAHFLEKMIVQAFFEERSKKGKTELKKLALGLWVGTDKNSITLIHIPDGGPYSSLPLGTKIALDSENQDSGAFEEGLRLMALLQSFPQLSSILFPILPGKKGGGIWLSISMVKTGKNATLYSDVSFNQIRKSYLDLEQNTGSYTHLAKLLEEGYADLEGKAYREANGKALIYPSSVRLKLEAFYYRYPLIEAAIVLYSLVLVLFCCGWTRGALLFFYGAFLFHTALLGLRIWILGRPPVSNMFETAIYVPWVASLTAIVLRPFIASNALINAASLVAVALLALLEITQSNASMENVQAVLDSQYWLIIHVLMVVGSYGLFLLAGVLGHLYLILFFLKGHETPFMNQLAKGLIQTLYLGVALLIPGTILGGVWAAESWGRFWDWDPKESWAFISSCIYLIIVHAYTFGQIAHFGLAIGAIAGLLSISFTWYGVNYILGTGLHSYGFGTGGEVWYYLYVACELAFIAGIVSWLRWKAKKAF